MFGVFFFKQKTAYELRISDWSSDVCSSDLPIDDRAVGRKTEHARFRIARLWTRRDRADFDKAEAGPRPCVEALAVLVEPGGQTDAIGEAQTKQVDRVRGSRLRKRQRPNSESGV